MAGFGTTLRLHLAQAYSNKAPKGRKNDFGDAKRLTRRLVAGELILSFVPDAEQRAWRTSNNWCATGCVCRINWTYWRKPGSSYLA